MTKKITISLISLLVILLIGLSFAYFAPVVTGTGNMTTLNSKKVNISYTSNLNVNITMLSDNNIASMGTFVVKNNENYDQVYNIVWKNLTNTLVSKTDLQYYISCTTTSGVCSSLGYTTIPNSGTNIPILSNVTISANATQTFNFNLRKLNDNQMNYNKMVTGKVIATIYDNESSYTYSEPNTNYVTGSIGKLIMDTNVVNNGESLDLSKAVVSESTYNSLAATTNSSTLGKDKAIVQKGLFKVKGLDNYYTYIFRGPYNNDFIKIGEYYGRITRINEDGTLRVNINLDNSNCVGATGENCTVYNSDTTKSSIYTDSDISTKMNEWYLNNLNQYDYLFEKNYYLNNNNDSTLTYSFNSYFDLDLDEGSTKIYSKIGLPSEKEVAISGLIRSRYNPDYDYLPFQANGFTMSKKANNFIVYYLNGIITELGNNNTGYKGLLTVMVNLKGNTMVKSGSGTYNDPYVLIVE